jgi:hypothetical protein
MVIRMRFGFETLGNASIVVREADRVVLATDPWLTGTCYFGSWALDRPLTEDELAAVQASEYIWISHGHPDHFHIPSLGLLRPDQKILLPDHYRPDIKDFLTRRGFAVEVLPYRGWKRLSSGVRVLCLDNENQDAILLIEAGDSLIVDLNDSPLCGDRRFIRDIVRRYDKQRTYVAALCSNDADLFNLVDAEGRRVIDPPERRKPGMIWALARIVESLGAGSYVSSASQHLYVRSDAVWANPYRVGWSDVVAHWTRPAIRIVEPFVKVDLDTGEYARKHPTQASDISQITDAPSDDDWAAPLSEKDWASLSDFFTSMEILRPYVDYLDFNVAGEIRRIWISDAARNKPEARLRGIAFHAPAKSLMNTVHLGYFDAILIGNFITAELRGMSLYPHFTPVVAKLAGASGVKTFKAWRQFRWRYFRRNPVGYLEWHLMEWLAGVADIARTWADRLHVKRPLKVIYRRYLGDPVR